MKISSMKKIGLCAGLFLSGCSAPLTAETTEDYSKLNINIENDNIKQLYTLITEFGTYINHSTLFLSKICECGNIVIRNNALKISLKHYQNTRNKM